MSGACQKPLAPGSPRACGRPASFACEGFLFCGECADEAVASGDCHPSQMQSIAMAEVHERRDARELAAAKASGFPTAPCVCCGNEGVVGYAGHGRAGCERCITGRCPNGNVQHRDWGP